MATIDSGLTAVARRAQIFTMSDGNLVAVYFNGTGWGYRIKVSGTWGSRTALTGTPASQGAQWVQNGDNVFGSVSGSAGIDFITYKLAYNAGTDAITQTNQDTGDNAPVLGVYLDSTRVYVVVELTSAGVYLYAFLQSNIATAPSIAAAQITAGSPPATGNLDAQWAVVGDGGATFYCSWFDAASSTFKVSQIVAGATAITTQTAETSVPALAAAAVGLDAIYDGTDIVFAANQNNAALRWARRTAANTYDSWTTLVTETVAGRPSLARKGTGAGSDLAVLYQRNAGQANGEIYKFCRVGGSWDGTSQSVAGGASTGWANPVVARSDVNQTSGTVPLTYVNGTASTWTLTDDSTSITASGTTNVSAPAAIGLGDAPVTVVAPSTVLLDSTGRSEATNAAGYTATGTKQWTHTPVGAVNGVVLAITQPLGSTDEVSGATYGGTAMTRIRSTPRTTTEAMRVYLYFLGSSVPQGAQTVAFTTTAGTAKQGHVYALATTDNTDLVSDSDNGSDLGIIANPSITVTHSGTLAAGQWAGVAVHGYGGAATPNLTASSVIQTGETIGFGHDPGAATAESYYRIATSSAASSTYGYTTLTSDDQLIAAVVVKPSAGTPATVTAPAAIGAGQAAAPALVAGSNVASPAAIGLGQASVPVVTGSGDADSQSPPADAVGSSPAPTVTATANATAPAAIGLGRATAPTVTGGQIVLSPAAVAAGQAPPTNQALSSEVAPGPASSAGTALAPAVAGTGDTAQTSPPADGLGQAPVPTVTAGSSTATPAATGAGQAPPPTINAGSTVTTPAAQATGQAPPPAVSATGAGTVIAPPATGIGQTPVPQISAGVTLASVIATGLGQAPSPAVISAATPPVADGTGQAPAPGLTATATLIATPATGHGTAPAPQVLSFIPVLRWPLPAYGDPWPAGQGDRWPAATGPARWT